MNWLGKIIQSNIHKNDIVLDLGCGIMQATTGIYDGKKSLKCRTILGVEMVEKYLDKVKPYYPTVKLNVKDTNRFVDDSYDVVICLDVLEHLELQYAVELLKEMKRIARKKVIIYTPKSFDHNGDNISNAWGLGENHLQQHHCLVTEKILNDLGYRTAITEIDHNILGVWTNE